MKILNTRPKHQAATLTALLKSTGNDVVELPLFRIASVALSNKHYIADIALFVSQNAVTHFFSQATLQADQVFAVGSATAQVLQNQGIKNVIVPPNFSSEGLLALPELKSVVGKKILIISGENSKLLLKQTLTARDAKVNLVVCYRRERISYSVNELPALKSITHIVVTSSESLAALIDLLKSQRHCLIEKTLCVISDEMYAIAKAAGFEKVVQANNATDVAIIKAIQEPSASETQ